jgi:large subunit ribosomal protein L21
MSYAILETGQKQYRAEKGQELDIELLDAKDGDTVKLESVLLYSDGDKVIVGQPYVKGAVVEAEVLKRFREKKVISFKYIRREGSSKRTVGHRQWKTRILIKDLKVG